MKEGLHPSDIDRMVAVARIAIGKAMESRYEAAEATARSSAGNDVRRVHRILNALHTLDVAFPREASAAARLARETEEAQKKRESAEREVNQVAPQVAPQVAQIETLAPLDLSALAALDNLDTPEARALLDALENVMVLAEIVDKQQQRGHTLPESIETAPSETRGTDFAKSVGKLILRLRSEVYGAKLCRE